MNFGNEQNRKSIFKFKLIDTDNYQVQNFIAEVGEARGEMMTFQENIFGI